MRIQRSVLLMASAAALITTLSPLSAQAATKFPMRQTKIELNAKVLSTPSAFTYHNTTYMPLFYVQQLLNSLQIDNKWNGTTSTWTLNTPFLNQPTFTQNTKYGPVSIVVNQKTFSPHVDKVVTIDPSSKKDTTFIPIWYIQQALKAIGLNSDWSHGTVWNVTVNYTDYSKTGTRLGAFSNLADAKTALLDYPGGSVQDAQGNSVFTEDSFKNVDLRYPAPSNINAQSLNDYLDSHSVLMAGLGQVLMDAETSYGVNANYLVSHAMEETGSMGNFSTIAQDKNNLYGYGAFDQNAGAAAGTFPSMAYAILFQAWEVRNNYLNPQSSHYQTPTLSGIAQNYASDLNWANKVNDLMDQLAINVHDNVTSYTQYSTANNPVPPAGSTAIPVYHLAGASGVVQADPYYGASVPVYQDGGVGHQYMFARQLQLGDNGDDVQTLQEALNQYGAGLTPDGAFGTKTQTALEQFQTSRGLQPTGICDFNLWNNVLGLTHQLTQITATQQIQIDEIVEGMVGGHVTEWYHIPTLGGWVNAEDVTLTNVYKVTVPSLQTAADASVTVDDASGNRVGTLHVGDYVVATNPAPSNGKIALQFSNQATGTAVTGYIDATKASLSQVSR